MNRYVLIREKESEKFIICYPRTIIPGYKFNSPEQDFDICWQYAVDAGLVEYGARFRYRFEFIIPDNLFNKNIAKWFLGKIHRLQINNKLMNWFSSH